MDKITKDKINLLVNSIANGDDEAFEQLYFLTYNVLYSFLKKYNKNDEIIKDVISQTFLIVIAKSSTLNNFSNCLGWILTIAKNCLFNEVRKSTKYEISAEDFNLITPEPNMDYLSIKEIIETFSQQDKNIIYYKYYYGYSNQEISQKSNCSVSTIKRKLKKIIDHLKNNLKIK